MDGSQWILRIRSIIHRELEDDDDDGDDVVGAATIAGVPKPLISIKPEAYVPQLIALGPYHHSRGELHHQMERYKLSAAKKMCTQLPPGAGFEYIVNMFSKVEYRIRAHYERYIPYDGESLAWVMAIDASFLLEFLQIFSIKSNQNVASKLNGWMNSARRTTSTHDMLVRDIIMLENQIPLFLLHKIVESQVSSSTQLAQEATLNMALTAFVKELTPFKSTTTNFQPIEIALQYSHLLELLYHSIVPNLYDEEGTDLDPNEAVTDHSSSDFPHKCKYLAVRAKEQLWARTKALMSLLLKFLLLRIPWAAMITSVPTIAVLKQPVAENMISNINPDCSQIADQGLSFDEIAIPSVTELANAGVRFEPTHGDMSSVAFDAEAATLSLPEISLDVNSEVVLRNLVAYEATTVTGPLALTRYVELMNGIIDTEEDAKLLREKGVLVNRLKSDEEVAELWNGMSRSVRLTKVKVLDEVIEEVNKYYNGRWKVKFQRFVRRYMVSSWESLVVVAFVFLLLLVVGLQAFSTGFGFIFGSWIRHRRGRA